MAVSIELKLDPLVKMEAKRHLNDTGRKKVASEVKRLCDPYVPFDTGMLKNTAQVLTDGVLYVQTYAGRCSITPTPAAAGRGLQSRMRTTTNACAAPTGTSA